MENINANLAHLKQKANRLPQSPGVYIMKDASGKIIYIGKAKALKNRVTQYFGSGNQHTHKVRQMVSRVCDFEYIICDSEFEALMLENSLIKQHQPKYNILLKDDKGYHYIKITNEKWRRITTCMQVENDGAQYIGPYQSGYVVKNTVDQAAKIFKLPDCNRSFDKYSKPCLNYHINRCFAPCKANISLNEYDSVVSQAIDFIKHPSGSVIKKLEEQMQLASERLDFEYAAQCRDRINAIKKMQERQKVVMCTYPSQDVFSCVFMGETACVSVLVFRNSRLTDKSHYIIEGFLDENELYREFLPRFYNEKSDVPPRIILDSMSFEPQALEQWLSSKANKKVTLIVPQKGEQKELVLMCKKNATEALSQHSSVGRRETSVLNDLAKLLGLQTVPRVIEAYDISNTAGDENVGAMVVFRDGLPDKSSYRKFKIKSFIGQDDYRSMAEVLDRRFCEYERQEDAVFSALPDLILLDGAQGQISAVMPVLENHGVSVALFGMVKDSKHRTRAIATGGADVSIKSNQSVFSFITAVQDEVHRFAIGYHKQRRSKKMLSSGLLMIDGIGEKRANDLLKHFKTLKALKEASVEEISAVKGIGIGAAKKIKQYFEN